MCKAAPWNPLRFPEEKGKDCPIPCFRRFSCAILARKPAPGAAIRPTAADGNVWYGGPVHPAAAGWKTPNAGGCPRTAGSPRTGKEIGP